MHTVMSRCAGGITCCSRKREALIAKAVDKRRREFATARACPRTALAALGWRRRLSCPGSGAPAVAACH